MNTFGSRSSLRVGSKQYDFFRISSLDKHGFDTARLPFSLRILLTFSLRSTLQGSAAPAGTCRGAR